MAVVMVMVTVVVMVVFASCTLRAHTPTIYAIAIRRCCFFSFFISLSFILDGMKMNKKKIAKELRGKEPKRKGIA